MWRDTLFAPTTGCAEDGITLNGGPTLGLQPIADLLLYLWVRQMLPIEACGVDCFPHQILLTRSSVLLRGKGIRYDVVEPLPEIILVDHRHHFTAISIRAVVINLTLAPF